MLRQTISKTMLASALLLGGSAVPYPALADVQVSINLGEERYQPFRTGMQRYFQVQDQDILQLSHRGLSAQEVPLALFIANRARVSPEIVMRQRLSGMRWDRISRGYGLSPSIFYVPVKDYSGSYGRLYRNPRSAWDSMDLSDEDYVDLANLKFLTDYYGYDSSRVIQLRTEGQDFLTIADLIGNGHGSSNHRYDDRYDDSYYDGYGDQYDSIGADDVLAPFLYTLVNYFGRPQQDIYSLRQRGISDYDLPVVLFLSRNARVTPMTIADLRLRGMNWMDISSRYNLNPEIYYVPVDYYDVQGSMYAPAYDMFRQPRSGWANLRFNDNDIVNLVNLKVQSEAYKTPPREIILRRTKGEDFKTIAREYHPRTMTQAQRKQYNSDAAARREARNREQPTSQTERQQRNSEAAANRDARNREQATNEQKQATNEQKQKMTEQEMRQQRNSEAAANRDARMREQEMKQEHKKVVVPETRTQQPEMTQQERQQRNSQAAAKRDAKRQQQAEQQAREQRKAEAAAQRDQKQKATAKQDEKQKATAKQDEADEQAANEKPKKTADDQAADEKNKKPKKKDN